jgi:hypothetical protein
MDDDTREMDEFATDELDEVAGGCGRRGGWGGGCGSGTFVCNQPAPQQNNDMLMIMMMQMMMQQPSSRRRR